MLRCAPGLDPGEASKQLFRIHRPFEAKLRLASQGEEMLTTPAALTPATVFPLSHGRSLQNPAPVRRKNLHR